MTRHIGTKEVSLVPMDRGAYNTYRGWEPPAGEDQAVAGYLVEYLDGGAGNDSRHQGYISWSPKGVADAAYRPVTRMTFGDAIHMMKAGNRVARAGWNGKGMFLELYYQTETKINLLDGRSYEEANWIGMKTADNKFVPWLASQTDMLAEDWTVV